MFETGVDFTRTKMDEAEQSFNKRVSEALTAANAVRVEPQEKTLEQLIRAEIDHAHINDHRLTPNPGKLQGDIAVRASYLEAVLDGWKESDNFAHPQATEPTWMPIESAPKDGSEILLGHPDGSMVIGWWREARSHGRVAGWSDGDDFAMTWPSHWQPIPAAPEAK